MLQAVRARWNELRLVEQFTLTASALVLICMLVIGVWVSHRIRHGVIESTALASAAHIEHHVAHLARDLGRAQKLPEESKARLGEIQSTFGERVVSIKIWLPDGTVVYGPYQDVIGKRFPVTANMQKALSGSIAAVFEGEPHEGDEHDHELRGSMIEVYAPVREIGTDRVIAVVEFYTHHPQLAAQLRAATGSSWIVVGAAALAMISALYGIVRNGSRTIDAQRLSLHRAHQRSAEINERVLRRIGSELHDGPAQLLSLSLLLIGSLEPAAAATNGSGATAPPTVDRIAAVLSDALADIRAISAGLVLPEIHRLSLDEVVRQAGRAHAMRTGTRVAFDVDLPASTDAPQALKVCAYRLVQEGLNNAFRHAEGLGQQVSAAQDGDRVRICVSDHGPGLRIAASSGNNSGLGLIGLRDRVETLGGTLTFLCSDRGCELAATFDLSSVRLTDIDHA